MKCSTIVNVDRNAVQIYVDCNVVYAFPTLNYFLIGKGAAADASGLAGWSAPTSPWKGTPYASAHSYSVERCFGMSTFEVCTVYCMRTYRDTAVVIISFIFVAVQGNVFRSLCDL